MRKKPSCFYSVHVVLSAQSFIGICSCLGWLFVILESYSIPVLILKTTLKRCARHVISISRIRTCIWIVNLLKQLFMLSWLTTWITVSNTILYGLSKVLLNRLQLVQNRAARIVTFTKKYEHIAPRLIDLHWSPVEYRIIYKISLLVYKAINGFSPSYISNLLSFCNSSFSLRSCSNKLL